MKSTSCPQVCKNTVYPQAPHHKGSVVNYGSIVINVTQRSNLLPLRKKIYSQTTSFSWYFSLNIQHHDIHVLLFLVNWRVPKEGWGEILLSIFSKFRSSSSGFLELTCQSVLLSPQRIVLEKHCS